MPAPGSSSPATDSCDRSTGSGGWLPEGWGASRPGLLCAIRDLLDACLGRPATGVPGGCLASARAVGLHLDRVAVQVLEHRAEVGVVDVGPGARREHVLACQR